MPHCTKCGTEVAAGAAFCPNCGQAQGAAAAPSSAPASSSTGLEPHLAAALAYLVITAVIWLAIEPYNKDRFIRFHSFQALGIFVVSIIGHFVLAIIPFLGWTLIPLWSLIIFVAAVFCAFKAFSKEKFKLPVIGDFAEKQAG